MGTLNYQTNYMKKKIQNLPATYSKMTNMDKLLMQMELAAMLGIFSNLDPREFGADYDRIEDVSDIRNDKVIDDNKNDIYDTSRDF